MPNMKDKELHNLVRDKLAQYQVPMVDEHWEMMADKIKRQPKDDDSIFTSWNIWKTTGLVLLLVLFVGIGYFSYINLDASSANMLPNYEVEEEKQQSTQNQENLSSAAVVPPKEVITNDNEIIDENPGQVKNIPGKVKRSKQARRFYPQNIRAEATGTNTITVKDPFANIDLLTSLPLETNPGFQPVSNTVLLEMQIKSNLISKKMTSDSTTYKIFERNSKHWKNAVVVCDWTTSMFKHGTEVVNWLAAQKDAKHIKGFVFFNDCDQDGNAIQTSKKPGQMFPVHSTAMDEVMAAMIATVRKGEANRDLEENDVEAIKFASEEFEGVEEIILIADNVSPVRKLGLLKDVNVPVKIVICGSTYIEDMPIQTDYIKIAAKTGGSIHTVEDDLFQFRPIPENTWVKVDNILYRFKNGRFKATTRKKRPNKSKN